jgi:hypothetical protein
VVRDREERMTPVVKMTLPVVMTRLMMELSNQQRS